MPQATAPQWMRSFPWTTVEEATPDRPLRMLCSACLVGHQVGWDDVAYTSDVAVRLARHPKVALVPFCPENLILGTPRLLTTIHNGNGFDVLDGSAQVLDSEGTDHTEAFIRSAEMMLQAVREHGAHFAMLTEISDSCGTNAIYLGHPDKKVYQKGPGVSAAMLIRNGVPVMGSRDYRCLGAILSILDGDTVQVDSGINMDETPWYLEYFKDSDAS